MTLFRESFVTFRLFCYMLVCVECPELITGEEVVSWEVLSALLFKSCHLWKPCQLQRNLLN